MLTGLDGDVLFLQRIPWESVYDDGSQDQQCKYIAAGGKSDRPVQYLCSGHTGAGEDSNHDGGGPGSRHWARLLPLLSCSQLALVEFTTFDVID